MNLIAPSSLVRAAPADAAHPDVTAAVPFSTPADLLGRRLPGVGARAGREVVVWPGQGGVLGGIQARDEPVDWRAGTRFTVPAPHAGSSGPRRTEQQPITGSAEHGRGGALPPRAGTD